MGDDTIVSLQRFWAWAILALHDWAKWATFGFKCSNRSERKVKLRSGKSEMGHTIMTHFDWDLFFGGGTHPR